MNKTITVEVLVNVDGTQIWDFWNNPEHIVNWAFASDDWECPKAENDLQVGGHFSYIMQAKDKSTSFNFHGMYTEIDPGKLIRYTMEGGRQVTVLFNATDDGIEIIETFEMENVNPEEMQRSGWQAILNNFKKYAESHNEEPISRN